MNKQFLKTTFIALVFGTVLAGVKLYYKSRTPKIETSALYENIGGNFSLSHESGPYTLKNLQGRPSVLYFGFASCPDICPLSLNKLVKKIDSIDPGLHNKIQKVFISVDYKRDDAKKVAGYGKYFASDFISLAGTKEQIEDITKKYAVHFEFVTLKDSAMEYTVDHTSRFFLLDKLGRVVNSYSDITNDEQFEKDLLETIK